MIDLPVSMSKSGGVGNYLFVNDIGDIGIHNIQQDDDGEEVVDEGDDDDD